MSIYIIEKRRIMWGGIIAARAITNIFVVHSILAVSRVGAVSRELAREENNGSKKEKEGNRTFSDVLQKEVDRVGTDSLDCHTVTYGVDGKIYHYEYLRREYGY